MSVILKLTGYDLSDEGPGRTVNEDATLVREDLGLFAVADGAGGRGKGNVAATLALRTIENYIGATVKRTFERADFDVLGLPEQAKRLSAAVHQAHGNLLEVLRGAPDRKGMATTVVAALLAPRTETLHIASVGDSRCYRLRHGRLELLTEDHTVATDVLQRRPEITDEVLAALPRNSVVRALGMDADFRVCVRSFQLIAGDRFLLCSDGLTSVVSPDLIEHVMSEPDSPSLIASELLSHALAAHSQDNISVLVLDVDEQIIDQDVPTQRYTEMPVMPPSTPTVEAAEGPSSGELEGPEVVEEDIVAALPAFADLEDEAETEIYHDREAAHALDPSVLDASDFEELGPATQSSVELSSAPPPPDEPSQDGFGRLPPPDSVETFNVSEIDLEIEASEDLQHLIDGEEEVSEVYVGPPKRTP